MASPLLLVVLYKTDVITKGHYIIRILDSSVHISLYVEIQLIMHFKDTLYDVAIMLYEIRYITNFQLFNECVFFSVLSVTCRFHTFVLILMYLFDIKFFLPAINVLLSQFIDIY